MGDDYLLTNFQLLPIANVAIQQIIPPFTTLSQSTLKLLAQAARAPKVLGHYT
jgi:hypothetical protein